MKRSLAPLLAAIVLSTLTVVPLPAGAQAPLCQGLRVTIDMSVNGGNGNGTPGVDVILGTPGPDEIHGFGGNDTICAGGGDDIVRGGSGNDVIYGETGNDKLFGQQGADRIHGGPGDDTIHGNLGTDQLYGEDGADRVFGYADNDLIDGGVGNDRLHGNFGDDIIQGAAGDDRIFGYGDDDTLNGGPGNDLIGGNRGNDVIYGDGGNDNVFGSDGSDIVSGGPGDDFVQGNSGVDTVRGDSGNDRLDGGIDFDRCVSSGSFDTTSRCETSSNSSLPAAPPVPTAIPATAPPPLPVTGVSLSGPAQFEESFDNNGGLNRFRYGLYHRDDFVVTQNTWPGDHDLSCGPPSTTRTIRRSVPNEFIYVCRDHVMTAIGDTSGYSVGWFAPNRVFSSVTEVCWTVTLTNLGTRQWWKVAVLSVNAPDVMSEVESSALSGIEGSDRAVASWGGVGGAPAKLRIGNARQNFFEMTAGNDKMTRYPACFRDNLDGTLTFTIRGPRNGGAVVTDSFTTAGSFPSGQVKVVFQDHNYTPTKSDNMVGTPIGYTWHWDDIAIR